MRGAGIVDAAAFVCGLVLLAGSVGCTSLPTIKHTRYPFPAEEAFVGDPSRPYTKLGVVRERAEFMTLDPNTEEKDLCKNYYNKAVKNLVKRAKAQGADAVIDVKSVVFYEVGQSEIFPSAECSDDGEMGQVLVQGIAVKWASPEPKPVQAQPQQPTAAPSVADEDTSGVTGTPAKALPAAKRGPRIPRPDERYN